MTYSYYYTLGRLGEIVSQRPDYVYPKVPTAVNGGIGDGNNMGCVYFDHLGQPSCLVGHFLAAEGFEPKDVVEGKPLDYQQQLVEHFDSEAWELLQIAQHYQDFGLPWGKALAEAVLEVKKPT